MTNQNLCLAIDTASDTTSVALLDNTGRSLCLDLSLPRGQGESLMDLMKDLFSQFGAIPQDLTCVAVTIGPGSFTGVRIGLATARGLGLALNIPVYGINNFSATAYGLKKKIMVVLDSKRSDYFIQDFDSDGLPTNEPSLLSTSDLKQQLPFVAVGSGARLLADEINCEKIQTIAPLALNIAQIALFHPELRQEPHPLYLRDADVTI